MMRKFLFPILLVVFLFNYLPVVWAATQETPTPSPTPTPTQSSAPQYTPTPTTQPQSASTPTPTSTTKSAVTAKPTASPKSTSASPSPTSGPVLSAFVIDQVSSNGARAAWQTNEPASSLVECRESGDYSEHARLDSLSTAHEIILSGLKATTQYTCRAKSTNAAGVVATGEEQSFTTLESESQQVVVQDAQSTSLWPILTGIIALLLFLFGWLWQRKRKEDKSQTKT